MQSGTGIGHDFLGRIIILVPLMLGPVRRNYTLDCNTDAGGRSPSPSSGTDDGPAAGEPELHAANFQIA